MSAKKPINTREFPLDHEPIEDWQRMDGPTSAREGAGGQVVAISADSTSTPSTSDDVPTTAFAELGTIAGAEYGLWEMSAGTMRDIEGDEVFFVISGTGRIEFDDIGQPTIELKPGCLVRLDNGMNTRWHIDEAPLRKLYIAPSAD